MSSPAEDPWDPRRLRMLLWRSESTVVLGRHSRLIWWGFFFFLQILEDTWFVGWTLKWVGWLVGWIGSCVVGYLISWSLFFFFSVCTIYLVVSWNRLVVLLVKCFLQVWSTDESIIWIYFCFISLPSRSCRERSFWEQSDEVCVHFTDWLWTDV